MTTQLYTPSELRAYAESLSPDQPTEDHIRLHRRTWAAISTDEELHIARSNARWLTERGDDEACPFDVREHTRIDNLAVIAAVERELAYRARKGIARIDADTGWPRELLDDLKARVLVTDEIDRAIGLRRRGSVMAGLCPFHNDHTPSLIVWPESQRWRCFACNIGGDVITWVQAWMPTDFRGAITYLSGLAGIPLPEPPATYPEFHGRRRRR